jgi:hypothetical protein
MLNGNGILRSLAAPAIAGLIARICPETKPGAAGRFDRIQIVLLRRRYIIKPPAAKPKRPC